MTSYRLVGTPKAKRCSSSAIDTQFRHGTVKAALSTTLVQRGLGASTRQGWRLSCGAAERNAHNAKATDNNAQYVGYQEPMLLVTAPKMTRAANTAGLPYRVVGDPADLLEATIHARIAATPERFQV